MSWFFARGESEHRDSIFQIAFEYGGSGGGVTWIGGVQDVFGTPIEIEARFLFFWNS